MILSGHQPNYLIDPANACNFKRAVCPEPFSKMAVNFNSGVSVWNGGPLREFRLKRGCIFVPQGT